MRKTYELHRKMEVKSDIHMFRKIAAEWREWAMNDHILFHLSFSSKTTNMWLVCANITNNIDWSIFDVFTVADSFVSFFFHAVKSFKCDHSIIYWNWLAGKNVYTKLNFEIQLENTAVMAQKVCNVRLMISILVKQLRNCE